MLFNISMFFSKLEFWIVRNATMWLALAAGTLLLEIKWRVWQAKARNKKSPRIKTGWTRTKFGGSSSLPANPYAQSHLYRLPSLLLLATVICVMFSMPVLCGGKLQRLELTDVFNRSILISDSVRILLLLHHNLPSPHPWIYLSFCLFVLCFKFDLVSA